MKLLRPCAWMGIASLVVAATPAPDALAGDPDAGLPAGLRGVAYEQRLGEQIPSDLGLVDARGKEVELGALLGERPVLLVPVYYECPMLCSLVLDGLVASLKAVDLDPGRDFEVVVFSFAGEETPEQAMAERQRVLARYYNSRSRARERQGGVGWRFLTGDAGAVNRLSEAIGFRFERDPQSGDYGHAAGIVVLTADGGIARVLYGFEYAPRDLRLALVEASEGRIGSPVDQLLLYCFRYDPAEGRYTAMTLNVVRLGGGLTALGLGLAVLWLLRRERASAESRYAGLENESRSGVG